jgi:hypothetical protein
MSMCVFPSAQSSEPDAGSATVKTVQALVGVLLALGIGSGPPKRHPTSEHTVLLPTSVDVVAPSVAVCPVQLVIFVMDDV